MFPPDMTFPQFFYCIIKIAFSIIYGIKLGCKIRLVLNFRYIDQKINLIKGGYYPPIILTTQSLWHFLGQNLIHFISF